MPVVNVSGKSGTQAVYFDPADPNVQIDDQTGSPLDATYGGIYGLKVHVVGDSDKYVRGVSAERDTTVGLQPVLVGGSATGSIVMGLVLRAAGDQSAVSDTGPIIFVRHDSDDAHTSENDGEYDTLSLTDFDELRTRDQRAIDLANCNVHTDYTVLDALNTTNKANSTNHVFGVGGIKFDKANGGGGVYAGVYQAFTAKDVSEIFEAGGFVGLGCYLSSLSNVVNVFLRIGTDASNYNCWTWPVAALTAATWLNLRTPASTPDYARNAGNGWNTSAIAYVAFGVEFNAAANILADIRFDHVHMVGGRVTATDIATSVTSNVNTPNINLQRVAGTPTDTGTGTSAGATQRVAVASDSSMASVTDITNTIKVKIDPAANLVNIQSTAVIPITVAGSFQGISDLGKTLVSPDASRNFKVYAIALTTTGIVPKVVRFTNGAGSATEFWRYAMQSPSGVASGANLAVTPPGYLFATGTNVTLAIHTDSASLVHYSVSLFKESA